MKKALSLVSILMLILGAVTLAVGVMNVSLLSSADSGVMTNTLIGLTVVLFILGGALDLIGGLLGLRAAKHSYKAGGAIIFGLLALIAAAASVVLDPTVQSICGCVVPLVYFICALAVKSHSRS